MWSEILPWIMTGGAGMVGRLMFHAKQVQRGLRKPFAWVLLWDLPIALGMGWIALGLGTWLAVPWEVTVSIALTVSYLGPHIIDLLFVRWSDMKFGGKKGE
jgi:hypothetical protein